MWSFSQSGTVKSVKDAFKVYTDANPLTGIENDLRRRADNALTDIRNKLGDDWPVNFSGSGSQTDDGNGNVTSVSVNISIT